MATDVTIPQIGESVATVEIGSWLKQPGDWVEMGDPVVEIESDKASMEVPAPVSGVLSEHLFEEGSEVDVGAPIASIDESADKPTSSSTTSKKDAAKDEASKKDAAKEDAAKKGTAKDEGAAKADDKEETSEAVNRPAAGAKAGPAARAEATEKGVDLKGVQGTGKGGRITRNDVSSAAAGGGTSAATDAPAPAIPQGETTRVKMSPLRRTIARRLVQAQQEAAMLTTFNEVDMSAVMALRKAYQERFVAKYGIKLGFMSFFVKGVIEGLKGFPAVNAQLDGDHVVYQHFYNIGIAVSGPKGLVVPVLKGADQLGFAQTEQAIADLGTKARDNKLDLSDFADGTFTISNGGIFGSMMSTPILNPPQVGILGMHNIVERAVVVNGTIEIRPMMYLALSYDHRIIDGREAVSFLVRIKECIEAPDRMLLEV